jgi:hypothetical protein
MASSWVEAMGAMPSLADAGENARTVAKAAADANISTFILLS